MHPQLLDVVTLDPQQDLLEQKTGTLPLRRQLPQINPHQTTTTLAPCNHLLDLLLHPGMGHHGKTAITVTIKKMAM